MNGNDFISWILRSPLHGALSNGMMLITVTGCKTGKRYTTPVGYYRVGQYLWVLTSRDRTWWKNVRGGAEVALLLKRKLVTAFAEPELEVGMVEERLRDYIQHVPQAARGLRVRVEGGVYNKEDIARLIQERLFVKIKLLA